VEAVVEPSAVYAARWVECHDPKVEQQVPHQGLRQPAEDGDGRLVYLAATRVNSRSHDRALAGRAVPRHPVNCSCQWIRELGHRCSSTLTLGRNTSVAQKGATSTDEAFNEPRQDSVAHRGIPARLARHGGRRRRHSMLGDQRAFPGKTLIQRHRMVLDA